MVYLDLKEDAIVSVEDFSSDKEEDVEESCSEYIPSQGRFIIIFF